MNMHRLTVSGLYIYPIKSCGGIAIRTGIIEPRGFMYDRRWMLVDANGVFMTQRNHPAMALIQTSVGESGLNVVAPGMQMLSIPLAPEGRERQATVWNDLVGTIDCGTETAEWFSTYLQHECSLVYQSEKGIRSVDPRYALNNEQTSLADGFPFLIIGDASLDALNEKLSEPVPMNRFRPNITIAGGGAFEEDEWKTIHIENAEFHLVKPCARCVLTTVNQSTGIAGKEPLRTLAEFRTVEHKVLFGHNALCSSGRSVAVGDGVLVKEQRKE